MRGAISKTNFKNYWKMYITEILTYLIWPVFIIVSWMIIRSAVILYDKKVAESQAEELKGSSEKK